MHCRRQKMASGEADFEFPLPLVGRKGEKAEMETPQGRVRLADGRAFDTMSAAATALTGISQLNGWRYFMACHDGRVLPMSTLKAKFPNLFGRQALGAPVAQLSQALSDLALDRRTTPAPRSAMEAWKVLVLRVVNTFHVFDDPLERNALVNVVRVTEGTEAGEMAWSYWFAEDIRWPDVVAAALLVLSRTEMKPGWTFVPTVPSPRVLVLTRSTTDPSCYIDAGLPAETAHRVGDKWRTRVLETAAAGVKWTVATRRDSLTPNTLAAAGRPPTPCVVITASAPPVAPQDRDTQLLHAKFERACLRFVARHADCTYMRRKVNVHELRIAVAQ